MHLLLEQRLCQGRRWLVCHFAEEALVEDVNEGYDFNEEELEDECKGYEEILIVAKT